MQIDTSTAFGERVVERLNREVVIWLTTVDSSGTPQPRPVWFVWEDGGFLIYSLPAAHKLSHIRRQPRVAVHFDGDSEGGDIVVFTGMARIDESAPRPDQHPEYIARYATMITDELGSTVEQFGGAYSTAIRVSPDALRGH